MKINLINLIDLISKKAPISKLGLGNYLSQLEIRIIRNSILLLSSFLFLLLPLNNSYAQTKPNDIIRVSPLIFNISLSPGKTYDYELNIENLTKFPLPLRASLENFTTTDEEGGYIFQISKPNPLLSWIKIDQTDTIIDEKSEKTIHITVTIPQKVPLGGYYGVLFLEPLISQKASNNTLVSAKVGALFLANVGVSGKDTKAQILTFDLPFFSEGQNIPFLLRVQNNGLNHFSAKPRVFLKPIIGKQGKIEIEEKFIFPGKARRWEENLRISNKWRGVYKATVRVSTGEGKYLEKSSYLISFPISKTIVIILIICIISTGKRL